MSKPPQASRVGRPKARRPAKADLWVKIQTLAAVVQGIVATVSIGVMVWGISTAREIDEIRSNLLEEQRRADRTAQEVQIARLHRDQLLTQARGLERGVRQAQDQASLAQADLATRLHELSLAQRGLEAARSEGHQLEGARRIAEDRLREATQARNMAVQAVQRAQVSIAVLRVLELHRLDQNDPARGLRLLYGRSGDVGAEPRSDRYQVFNQVLDDSRFCQLPGGGSLVSVGFLEIGDVRNDAFMQALCRGLSEETVGQRLDDFTLIQSGVPVTRPYVWMDLGSTYIIDVQPYIIGSNTYSDRQIELFWSLLELQIVLDEQDRLEVHDRIPDISEGTEAIIISLIDSWGPFVERLMSPEYRAALERTYDDPSAPWRVLQIAQPTVPLTGNDSIDQLAAALIEHQAPPDLRAVPESSIESLSRGALPFTRRFDEDLICAAAWHAELHGLIEMRDRLSVCFRP